MKKSALALCAIALTASANAAVVSTIDPNNVVDQSATGTNLISLNAFQALINTTNDTSLAGVLDAEGIAGDANGDFTLDPDYGTLQLGITGTTRYGRNVVNESSGIRGYYVSGTNNLTLTAPTGGLFTHFGLVATNIEVTDAGGGQESVITATFSDSTTTTYDFDTAGQTFVGFAAPAGESITQISITRGLNSAFDSYDDVSFVTTAAPIPEPSSTALLGLASLGLILRRRK